MTERDLGERTGPYIFDDFAPGVNFDVAGFLMLSERTGALAKLDPERAELIVEYFTSDVTMQEMGGCLGLTSAGVSANIKSSFRQMYRFIANLSLTDVSSEIPSYINLTREYHFVRKHIGKNRKSGK